ncbi:MAG: LytR C-terminal domain-containing protein [Actinobacteria bacterium]|nr:LytR C-terminal domain-containing protein [Actinomycetota bacterium]
MKNDTPWPPPSTTTAADGTTATTDQPLLRTKPENIKVSVLNGTAEKGKAKRVAKLLRKQGYSVQEVGNADTTDVTTTTVQYDPAWDTSAKTLMYAATAQGEKVKKQGATMNLIIGTDFTEIKPVEISELTQDYTTQVNTGDEEFCAS